MNISTLLNDLTSVTHGTTVNKVPNIYGIINRAARSVLADVDPKETTRIVSLGQVFNDIFDYAIPPDVKGDRIIDLRPQAGRKPNDVWFQNYAQNFDANKDYTFGNGIITQWNTGIKTLRINAPSLTAPVQICDTSSIVGFSAAGGATTPTVDTSNYVAGGGALNFNLSAGQTTGAILSSSLTPIDLTAHQNISYLPLWVYLPTGASFSSINLLWGSDTSNAYNLSVTATQQGTAFKNGWNLLAFSWESATKVGTPNVKFTDTMQVTFTYDGTLQTGVKVCNLLSVLGYYFELQYYSKFLFRNPTTGVFQEEVTDASDDDKLINLDTESYNLLFNKTAFYVAQTLQGADADHDEQMWDNEYQNELARYKAMNPMLFTNP